MASPTVNKLPATSTRSPRPAVARAAPTASATDGHTSTVAELAARATRATSSGSALRTLSLRVAWTTSAIAAIGRTTPSTSLFALTASTTCSRSHRKNSGERFRQRLGPRRVVRAVEHDRGFVRDHLEPAGGAQRRETLVEHCLVEGGAGERLERDGAGGGVARRVAAEHRQVQVLVGRTRGPQTERLTPDRDQRVEHLPVVALAQERRADLARVRAEHILRDRLLFADRRDLALLEDPRLLGRDVGERRSELRDVVHPDRGDHGSVAGDHVRRVPRSAHPDLEDAELDGFVGEPQEREPVIASK